MKWSALVSVFGSFANIDQIDKFHLKCVYAWLSVRMCVYVAVNCIKD